MRAQPTVFVADDDVAVRQSLRWLLESAGMSTRVYGSAEEFLADLDANRPGCLLLDVRMPGMGGLALQKELRRREIHLPVIIITGHADVGMAIDAMKAGAMDFIEKPFDDETLLNSVHCALKEDSQVRGRAARRNEVLKRLRQLTTRERQVLELVVQGWSSRRIASKLGVVAKTVEVHRANLMRKMKAQSLADLVRMAIIAGI